MLISLGGWPYKTMPPAGSVVRLGAIEGFQHNGTCDVVGSDELTKLVLIKSSTTGLLRWVYLRDIREIKLPGSLAYQTLRISYDYKSRLTPVTKNLPTLHPVTPGTKKPEAVNQKEREMSLGGVFGILAATIFGATVAKSAAGKLISGRATKVESEESTQVKGR